jgi:ABC-type hemin transport system substrate-binding protein
VGPAPAIRSFLATGEGGAVLSERTLGPTMEVALDGAPPPRVLERLRAQGIESRPVSFQDAFVNLIQEDPR